MVKQFTVGPGSAVRSLAALAGGIATVAAVIVGALMAVFAAATVAVIALMASALLALAGLALRARRTVRARAAGSDIIEARHQGGHHWVATGWKERP